MKRKIKLTDEQKQKAKRLAKRVKTGEVDKPDDFLDDWGETPDEGLVWGEDLVLGDEWKNFVKTENIKGTSRQNIDRLEQDRLIKILGYLYRGEYVRKPKYPPHLERIDGELYVASNGNHRAMAHKFLEIDKMYAGVSEYNVKTERAKRRLEK